MVQFQKAERDKRERKFPNLSNLGEAERREGEEEDREETTPNEPYCCSTASLDKARTLARSQTLTLRTIEVEVVIGSVLVNHLGQGTENLCQPHRSTTENLQGMRMREGGQGGGGRFGKR